MKLHRFEIALALALVVVFVWSAAADATQSSVSDKLTRLHVIANSDSADDQALKLKVRDSVLEVTQKLVADSSDAQDARQALGQGIEQIRSAAQQTVLDNGSDYSVTATLESDDYFPKKDYTGFSLPAGEYTALKVVIGEGEGQNWWCVVFPPLCMAAAEGELTQAARDAGLTKSELHMIASDGTSYEVRFMLADLFNRLRHHFTEN